MLPASFVSLVWRSTKAKWWRVKMPTMPTTIAVTIILTTVQILKQQLSHQDVVRANASLLQKEPKYEPKGEPRENWVAGETVACSAVVDFLTAFSRVQHCLGPEHQVCDDGASDKEADDRDP